MRLILPVFALIAAFSISASAQPSAAPSNGPAAIHEPASPEVRAARVAMRQACAPDIKSLCADVQQGGGKVMQCLRSHAAQLSETCKSAAANLRAARKDK
jgi:hypothetical protein